jgi:hypothetical protein
MKAIMAMFDSLNRRFLPPYGCDWIHAPNFERLARRDAYEAIRSCRRRPTEHFAAILRQVAPRSLSRPPRSEPRRLTTIFL